MKKILFATVAVLALSGCGEDKNSCEFRMQNLKNPKDACSCMNKVMEENSMTMAEYLAFGEKIEKEENMEAFMKPSAEMKKFIEVARDITMKCNQHFEEKEAEKVEATEKVTTTKTTTTETK